MAAVSTASLCPGLSRSRRGHAKPPRTTVCHCLPARKTEEGVNRRDALLGVLLSATAVPLLVPDEAFAETAEAQKGFTAYEDEANKFTLVIPQGWQVGAGERSGFKNVTAFFPERQRRDHRDRAGLHQPQVLRQRRRVRREPGDWPGQELAEAGGARREAHRLQGVKRPVLNRVHAAEPRREAPPHRLRHRDGVQRLVQPAVHGDRPVHRRRGGLSQIQA